MFERGVEDEVARRSREPVSRDRARRCSGCGEIAELPRARGASSAIVGAHAPYAAYQRKWMRRIPGLVSVRADRPAGEIADEILEVARAR